MSENGALLADMISRQGLTIVNASVLCTGGPVTRRRVVQRNTEASCIDFIITSPDLDKCLLKAIIDKHQLYALTKYTTTKGIPSIKRSDHYTIIAEFKMEWKESKPHRQEIFKLRDSEGLQKFKKLTSEKDTLLKCSLAPLPLAKVFEGWYKEFNKLLPQCFKKIRVTQTPPKRTIDFQINRAMMELKELKIISSQVSSICKPVVDVEIQLCEHYLAIIQGEKCKKIIYNETRNLVENDVFNSNGAWALKKKLFPKCSDPPFAVFDKNEQLVTDSQGIIGVMKEEFAFRLRNREMNPEYEELRELKEYLCALRLQITKNSDFCKWSVLDVEKAVTKLKNNKCRDPHGHINELYKHLGKNGLESITNLLNRVKEELMIPDTLKLSNVTALYKGKGSKQNVVNLRGIFKLPIVRNILDKLIYHQERDIINQSMGQFQVGNQCKRNIRDHTFVVHAIMNEAQSNKTNIDLQFTDIKQCFDSIWLDEAINDLYDSGVISRNLNLLYEGNRSTDMCVENKYGRSDRVRLHKIVMQGSVTGGTLCSNQIAKLCHKSYNERGGYMYCGKVPVPALAMVDDVVNVTVCNTIDSIQSNVQTDEFVKKKKLESQVGEGKCQWIHVGKDKCTNTYTANGATLTECSVYKYLGDHVADDGFDTLYKKRYERAQGYSISCQAMCTEISLGFQIYSVAKLLHEAIFLNGTLCNVETWPHFTPNRLKLFEKAEQSLFRKVLKAHSKTPIECLYLELGVVPFRFHVMTRRIMFLQTLMQRDDNELTKKVLMCQKEVELNGDFYVQVKCDLEQLNISQNTLTCSKEKLKDLVMKSIHKHALSYLKNLANQHSKVRTETYNNLGGICYFYDPRFTPDLANMLFKFRTRMYNVRNNFRNKYQNSNILCPLCTVEKDTQEHLLKCTSIQKNLNTTINLQYEDIFSNDNDTLLNIAKSLKKIIELREEMVQEIDPED